MEFFQEPIFTAFVAIVLSFVVAKIVSFAVSNSNSNGVCSVNQGAVAQGVGLNRELRVKKSKKGQKRVKFVDDVVITRIDRYEDFDNLEFLDETKSDEFGGLGLNDDSRVEKIDEFEQEGDRVVSEKGKSVIVEEEKIDEFEKEGGRVISEKGKSVIVEEEKIDEFEKEGGRVGSEKGKSVIVEEEKIEVMGFGENEGVVAGEDDDWEGIERSELEKVFAEAVNYVEYGGRKEKEDDHLEKLTSDVQMELYGLHKVAVEGPCGGPQPMALKVSARAKWNAWQRLGNMSQEVAMEQYIRALSDSIPAWMHDYSADDVTEKMLETEHERKSKQSSSLIGDSKEEDAV